MKNFIFRKIWALYFFSLGLSLWLVTSISPLRNWNSESRRLKIILRDHLNHHSQRLNRLLEYSEMKSTSFKVPSPVQVSTSLKQGVYSGREFNSHILTRLFFFLLALLNPIPLTLLTLSFSLHPIQLSSHPCLSSNCKVSFSSPGLVFKLFFN